MPGQGIFQGMSYKNHPAFKASVIQEYNWLMSVLSCLMYFIKHIYVKVEKNKLLRSYVSL